MPSERRGENAPSTTLRWKAYAAHLYTAFGVVAALLAATEICASRPSPGIVFFWLAVAVFIDGTDGPLARRWEVERYGARIRGRTLDDIIDYLTFSFLPLLLVWRMDWLAEPKLLWIALAMMASLFGFANVRAKEEELGFFVGFPSYWNVAAFYLGIWASRWGDLIPTVVVVFLAVLTLLPVRFVYPNFAPAPWRRLLIGGALGWLLLLLLMLPTYPLVPIELGAISFLYPLFYIAASFHLARRAERELR